MQGLIAMPFTFMADTSSAASVMSSFIVPVIRTLCIVATPVCVFFLVNGGIAYMSSGGKPDKLEHAKRIIRNALIGLVIVIAAAVLTEILTHAYASSSAAMNAKLPNLTDITPKPVSNGVVAFIIKMITGVLNDIVQTLAWPFIHSLAFFTSSTPLMANNSTVFNLWLAMVGITDALFVLIVALLGFHVMSASTLGLDEIELKHLLPRVCLIFLAINTSIFAIDGVIELSNAMIHAVTAASGVKSVWDTLTAVVNQSAELGLPALLIMVAFLIFSVILVVYYVGRLISLYIGAVLAPIVLLLWLIPPFRNFAETAARVYIMTIFVLFVHVIILQLAASLFGGVVVGSPTQVSGTLMPMITGLATLIALLKTQGVMMQFSYASIGPRSARQLGGQIINAVSFIRSGSRSSSSDRRQDGLYRGGTNISQKKSFLHQSNTTTVSNTNSRGGRDAAKQQTPHAPTGQSTTGTKPAQKDIGRTKSAAKIDKGSKG